MKALLDMVKRLLRVLPAGSRRFIVTFASVLGALALLDIAALGLLALLLSPLLSGNSVTVPVVRVTLETPAQFGVALLLVCALIVAKDLAAVVVQRASTRRFARFEQSLGAQLLDSFFYAPWTERLSRNSTDLVRSTDVGVASTVTGVLIPFTQLMGEVSTFVAVMVVLIVAQPVMAVVVIIYFALVAGALYVWVIRRSVASGRDNRTYSTRSVRLVAEMVDSLKEITLRDKAAEVEEVVLGVREKASLARANQSFYGAVPRYALEIGLVGGLILAAAVGYLQGGITEAFSALALFGVAGFRVVPSLTRFQTIMGQTGANMPYAERVLEEIKRGRRHREAHTESVRKGLPLADEPGEFCLESVSFTYPGSPTPAVQDVSLTLPFGSSLALVGESGSGKSTLVDVMLGLLDPSSGQLTIDGTPLTDTMRAWRSRIGYVPQQVALFDSSVAHNVALSWVDAKIDEDRVRRALQRAQLLDVIEAREGGIWGRVGEDGMNLSGGQRQRLGIARALYAEPLVLFMDEATSSLDTATEAAVTDAVKELSGEVTTVTVAHRLATVRHCDQICFMRGSRLVAHGTFEAVVDAEPDFARQAALAGLLSDDDMQRLLGAMPDTPAWGAENDDGGAR